MIEGGFWRSLSIDPVSFYHLDLAFKNCCAFIIIDTFLLPAILTFYLDVCLLNCFKDRILTIIFLI